MSINGRKQPQTKYYVNTLLPENTPKPKLYTNTPLQEEQPLNPPQTDNYQDEFLLIESLENFRTKTICFPSFDLMNYLVLNNSFPKAKIAELIKTIDSDLDGFISLLDILSYLLHTLKHRSVKVALQFLCLKIYTDFKLKKAEHFFTKNNIELSNEINASELSDLLLNLLIKAPITNAIVEKMKLIFPTPNTYQQLADWINEYKEVPINKKSNNKNNNNKSNVNQDTQSSSTNAPYLINMDSFENQLRLIVQKIIHNNKDVEIECGDNEELIAKELKDRLNTLFKNIDNNNNGQINIKEYNKLFVKPLRIDPYISTTLFQLLKKVSPEGEQFITQQSLFNLLESYSSLTSTAEIFDNNNFDDEFNSVERIIEMLEDSGPSLKYVFEKIPFCKEGVVPICELKKTLDIFYRAYLHPQYFTILIETIDKTKIGYISYPKLQSILRKYGTKERFSPIIEFQHIASKLLHEKELVNVNSYFLNNNLYNNIKNINCVKHKEHDILLQNLFSSNEVKFYLFDYLCKKSQNTDGYRLDILISLIEQFYLPSKYIINIPLSELNRMKKERSGVDISLTIKDIEEAIKNISLGNKATIAVIDILHNIHNDKRNEAALLIDPNKKGFIRYSTFIDEMRSAYGNAINLNIKLCAQYVFKLYIKQPDKISEFIIAKSRLTNKNLDIYVSHDTFYSNFFFAFVNDHVLFETFYMIYKEKKGEHKDLLNLRTFYNFIICNNIECNDGDFDNEFDTEINKNLSIKEIISKYSTSIKNILKSINHIKGELQNNFTISEQYIFSLLITSFNIEKNDVDTIVTFCKTETNRFNIRKLYEEDKTLISNRNNILLEEIVPKIKKHMSNSGYNTYKTYCNKIFDKQNINFCELCTTFHSIYQLNFFECLVIINNENNLNIDKFFTETSLKNSFTSSEYSPALKTAIKKLNEYFTSHKDKLKIFKQYDTDKNCSLSKEEFITFLNTFKDLELTDNQKLELLTIADKNKDGKIIPREFLRFVKVVRTNEGKASTNVTDRNSKDSGLPMISNRTVTSKDSKDIVIVTDVKKLKDNIKINKQIAKQSKDDFLNLIIILQEDLEKNYNKFNSLEQNFYDIDTNKVGVVGVSKFSVILKKRLPGLSFTNFEKFVIFANKGLVNSMQTTLTNEQKIHYPNFLEKLANYQHPQEHVINNNNDNVSIHSSLQNKKSTS